ncbi:hypothetical protein ACP70R_032373 [Stipagrostis hirtigluma subsp. patula]
MVMGHARLGFEDEAVGMFLSMADGDGCVAVDAVAAAAGFAACAAARDLALGREAHRRVAAAEVPLDVVAWHALVDMHAKRWWFSRMPAEKTVVSLPSAGLIFLGGSVAVALNSDASLRCLCASLPPNFLRSVLLIFSSVVGAPAAAVAGCSSSVVLPLSPLVQCYPEINGHTRIMSSLPPVKTRTTIQ